MALFILPNSTTETFYTFQSELDERSYNFQFKFNQRDQAWYMNISDAEDNILRAGLKVVTDSSLIRLWKDFENRPPGDLVSIAFGGIQRPALENELGGDVQIWYVDEESLAELSA